MMQQTMQAQAQMMQQTLQAQAQSAANLNKTPPQSSASSSSQSSPATKIKKAHALMEAGIISEEEFKALKKKLLEQLGL